ncbi:hypothetical protein KM043_009547 [Ampulex compressa]|nr:hypothetical protein KM043_009547 [Ampulex compressa]
MNKSFPPVIVAYCLPVDAGDPLATMRSPEVGRPGAPNARQLGDRVELCLRNLTGLTRGLRYRSGSSLPKPVDTAHVTGTKVYLPACHDSAFFGWLV